jgi:hypothetical protein
VLRAVRREGNPSLCISPQDLSLRKAFDNVSIGTSASNGVSGCHAVDLGPVVEGKTRL